MFKTRETLLAENHRKVEAMYRRGMTTDEIARTAGLDTMDVLDIIQKIHYLDERKKKRIKEERES